MQFVLQIPDMPVEAFHLMVQKTVRQSYQEMVERGGITRIELLTFAWVTVPIVRNDTKEIDAYVSTWEDGKVSVCMVGEGDWLTLAGIEDQGDPPPALAGEWEKTALQLFLKYHPIIKALDEQMKAAMWWLERDLNAKKEPAAAKD